MVVELVLKDAYWKQNISRPLAFSSAKAGHQSRSSVCSVFNILIMMTRL
jgi:hypothetical protein